MVSMFDSKSFGLPEVRVPLEVPFERDSRGHMRKSKVWGLFVLEGFMDYLDILYGSDLSLLKGF